MEVDTGEFRNLAEQVAKMTEAADAMTATRFMLQAAWEDGYQTGLKRGLPLDRGKRRHRGPRHGHLRPVDGDAS